MECKFSKWWRSTGRIWVLIETLWNVNRSHLMKIHKQQIELIETLWNVNDGNYTLNQDYFLN